MLKRRPTIRDHSAEANLFARRTFIAFMGVVVLLLLLFSNIFDLDEEKTFTTCYAVAHSGLFPQKSRGNKPD